MGTSNVINKSEKTNSRIDNLMKGHSPDKVVEVSIATIDPDWRYNTRTCITDDLGVLTSVMIESTPTAKGKSRATGSEDNSNGSNAESDRSETSFQGLKLNLYTTALAKVENGEMEEARPCDGQDVPITLRPHPKPNSKYQWVPVLGFCRLAALTQLAQEANDPMFKGNKLAREKDPKIRAFVRNLTDEDALKMQIRENTARMDLTTADICSAVGRLRTVHRGPTPLSQLQCAAMIGKSQGFVGRLFHILDKVKDPELLNTWRKSPAKLPGGAAGMESIVDHPTAEEQDEAFRIAVGGQKKSSNAGPDGWAKVAAREAYLQGERLGHAEKGEALKVIDSTLLADAYLTVFVPLKAPPSAKDEDKVTKYELLKTGIKKQFVQGYIDGKAGKRPERLKREKQAKIDAANAAKGKDGASEASEEGDDEVGDNE